jgi:hypothetical protein
MIDAEGAEMVAYGLLRVVMGEDERARPFDRI